MYVYCTKLKLKRNCTFYVIVVTVTVFSPMLYTWLYKIGVLRLDMSAQVARVREGFLASNDFTDVRSFFRVRHTVGIQVSRGREAFTAIVTQIWFLTRVRP